MKPRREQLALAARRRNAGTDGRGFSDVELVALDFFASLPELHRGTLGGGSKSKTVDAFELVFDETNLLVGHFWHAYFRDPERVLRVVGRFRRAMAEVMAGRLKPADAAQVAAFASGGISAKERARLACEVAGQKPQSAAAMARAIRRFAAAGKGRDRVAGGAKGKPVQRTKRRAKLSA